MKKLYWQEILFIITLLAYYIFGFNTYLITGRVNIKSTGLLNILEVLVVAVLVILYLNQLIPEFNKPLGFYYSIGHAGLLVVYCIGYWCICIVTNGYFHFGVFAIKVLLCALQCGASLLATYSLVTKQMTLDDLHDLSDDMEDLYDDI